MKKLNPVFLIGIQTRMRGVRAPILMSVYYLILLGIFTVAYATTGGSASYYYSVARPRSDGMELLTVLYSLLVIMIFAVVVLMVPAMNAGNIASEREKQTLDLLLSSRLSAIEIVTGKIFSNLVFIAFLLVLALPLFAVTYLFGSIMILDIVKMFLYMVVSAYACASLSTFFSALVKKTSVATILCYIALVLFCVITIVVGAYIYSRHVMQPNYAYDDGFVPFVWKINPIFSVYELISSAEGNTNQISSFFSLYATDFRFSFIVHSSALMLGCSVLLNIASAILIKPVRKLQIRS